MQIKHVTPSYTDDRGEIMDILDHVAIDSSTLITSKRGARRGDHYHKESEQYLYVVSGKVKLIAQMPDGQHSHAILERGYVAYTPPLERHTYIALEDSVFLVLTKGPRGGQTYESDTFRLPEPLPAEC